MDSARDRAARAHTAPARPQHFQHGDGLIVVDVQRDFLPGGKLAVPDGDAVVAPLNAYIRAFRSEGLPIVFTRDWHPADHCSFSRAGGPWPAHCVQGTNGAAFASGLDITPADRIVSKGTVATAEAYSAFSGTTLSSQLRELGIRRVFVGGLATDYCVLETVKDARALGFEAGVLRDAIRAVDVRPGDADRALEEMQHLGATLL